MVNITDSMDTIAQYIIDLLKANVSLLKASVSNVGVPGVEDIYYGDQEKFPRSPSICVDVNSLQRTLQGFSYRSDNAFIVYIYVHHARIQGNQLTRKEAQQISEVITTLIHADPQLGGNVIHGFVSTNESGYTYRQNTMYRTNRLTYEPYTKTRLR